MTKPNIENKLKQKDKKDTFWVRFVLGLLASLMIMSSVVGIYAYTLGNNHARADTESNPINYITPSPQNYASSFYPYGRVDYGIGVPTDYNAVKYLYHGSDGNYYVFYEQSAGFVLYYQRWNGAQMTTILTQSDTYYLSHLDGSLSYDAHMQGDSLVISGFSGDLNSISCKQVIIEAGSFYIVEETKTITLNQAGYSGKTWKAYGDYLFSYSDSTLTAYKEGYAVGSSVVASLAGLFNSNKEFKESCIIACDSQDNSRTILWAGAGDLYEVSFSDNGSSLTTLQINSSGLLTKDSNDKAIKHIISLPDNSLQVTSLNLDEAGYEVNTYNYVFNDGGYLLSAPTSSYSLVLPYGIASSSVVHVIPIASPHYYDYVVLLGNTSHITFSLSHNHIPVNNHIYGSQFEAYSYSISTVGSTVQSCCMETSLNTYDINVVIRVGDDLQSVSSVPGFTTNWVASMGAPFTAEKIQAGASVNLYASGAHPAYEFVGWAIYNPTFNTLSQYISLIEHNHANAAQHTPASDTTYVALFNTVEIIPDPLNITLGSSVNGTISCVSQTFEIGQEIIFSSSPSYNYVVDCWYVNGSLVQNGGNVLKHIFGESGSYVVSATFKRELTKTTEVSAVPVNSEWLTTGGAVGFVGLSNSGPYYAGEKICIQAFPSTGFTLEGWYLSYDAGATYYRIDDSLIDSEGFYMLSKENLNNSTGAITFLARIVYADGTRGSGILDVTVERALPSGEDAGVALGAGYYSVGQTVYLSASVNEGYTFTGWFRFIDDQWVKQTDSLIHSFVVAEDDTLQSPFEFRAWFGGSSSGGVNIESWRIKDVNGNVIHHGGTIFSINGEVGVYVELTPSNSTENLIFSIVSGEGEVTLSTKSAAIISCYSQYLTIRVFCEGLNNMQEFTVYSPLATGFTLKHITDNIVNGNSFNVSGGDATLSVMLIPQNASGHVIIEVIEGTGSATMQTPLKWTISGEGAVKFRAYLENNPDITITFSAVFGTSWWESALGGVTGFLSGLGAFGTVLKYGLIVIAVAIIAGAVLWILLKLAPALFKPTKSKKK